MENLPCSHNARNDRTHDENAAGSTRREFVISSALAAGGLLLHGVFSEPVADAQTPARHVALNAWLKIAPDNTVTIISSQAEMGQGIQTTLPAVLADELGADWTRVRLENAPADAAYRNPRLNWQFTGNSESTTAFFDLMREMGARGRHMLVAAAASRWNVDPASCRTESSRVVHRPTRRSLTFGDLAAEAAAIPAVSTPTLKRQSE